MATAVLIVLGAGFVGTGWMIYFYADRIMQAIKADHAKLIEIISGFDDDFDVAHQGIAAIRDVLTKASQIKAAKQPEPVFDRDTLQPMKQPRRYVPIASRRAQAEAASLGPQTHRDEVIANDARAMEQA